MDGSDNKLNIFDVIAENSTTTNKPNIVNLFKLKESSFKEKLIAAFVSLSYPEAKTIFKLFESLPEVKEAWFSSLEKRIENQKLEVDHLNSQVDSLDKDLNDLLEKYTKISESHDRLKSKLKAILQEKRHRSLEDDASTDLEFELIEIIEKIIEQAKSALYIEDPNSES